MYRVVEVDIVQWSVLLVLALHFSDSYNPQLIEQM